MDDIHQKIAALRGAATQFSASGSQVHQIVANVAQTADDLAGIGFESPAAQAWMTHYRGRRGWMDQWANTLAHFADQLHDAADQVEAQAQTHDSQAQVHHGDIHQTDATAEPTETITPPEPREAVRHFEKPPMQETLHGKINRANVDDYLSTFNRARYEAMLRDTQLLDVKTAQLDQWVAACDGYALTARMLGERMATESTPQLAAQLSNVESQLEEAAARVKGISWEVDQMRQNMDTINARMALVRPAMGADLNLIRSMEGTTNPIWLRDNTYDCVRYVIERVPVPPQIANHAYLWDDRVSELRRYGITVGQEPLPGSVLVMEREHSYANDIYGHVMVVERVDADGSIWVTDNIHPDEAVLLQNLTDELSGSNIKYLYLPWHTQI